MESTMPHNGKIFEEFIRSSGLSIKELAHRMDVTSATLLNYCKSKSLHTRIWWKASQALNQNLIADIGNRLPIPFITQEVVELRKQLNAVQKELEVTQIELNVYKNIVRRQK